jgi:hypothetical protein
MGLTYLDVIISRFGETEFTTEEFTLLTGSSRSAKLLSELKMKGYVTRVGRGKYKVSPMSERLDTRLIEWERVRNIVLNAPFKKAWTGSTAVEVWTNGRYKISPNPYLRVFHLMIYKSELDEWHRYLMRFGVSYIGKKKIGSFVSLEKSSKFEATMIAGEPVIPRDMVLKLIRSHPGLYEGAEKLIEY